MTPKSSAQTNKNSVLTLWDTNNQKPIKQLNYPTDKTPNVIFSPVGSHFSINDSNIESVSVAHYLFTTLQLWDAKTGVRKVLSSSDDCDEYMTEPVFSSDGKQLADVCNDGILHIWKVETGEIEHEIKLEIESQKKLKKSREDNNRLEIGFVQNNKKIAFLNPSNNEILEAWEIATGTIQTEICSETEEIIKFSPNGRLRVTRDEKDFYRLRRDQEKDCHSVRLNQNENLRLDEIKFSEDSNLLSLIYYGSALDGYALIVKDLITMKDLKLEDSLPLPIVIDDYFQFSQNGRWLLFRNHYWDLSSGKRNRLMVCTKSATFSVDEKRLITDCDDGTLKFQSLESGQEVLTMKAHNSPVKNVVLMKNNKYLLTTDDAKLKLWRTKYQK